MDQQTCLYPPLGFGETGETKGRWFCSALPASSAGEGDPSSGNSAWLRTGEGEQQPGSQAPQTPYPHRCPPSTHRRIPLV